MHEAPTPTLLDSEDDQSHAISPGCRQGTGRCRKGNMRGQDASRAAQGGEEWGVSKGRTPPATNLSLLARLFVGPFTLARLFGALRKRGGSEQECRNSNHGDEHISK